MAWPAWASRAFRVLPTPAAGDQKGVTFVGILFGIAVGTGAQQVAGPIVDAFRPAADTADQFTDGRYVTIMHYMVAFTLTVTSFLGYYTSQNVPRLAIRFFNISFMQFVLDVSMVISYFFLFFFAERPADDPNARPEAAFVLLAFALYVVWDLLSLKVGRDPLSQLALGRSPSSRCDGIGYRRKVTIGFFLLSSIVFLVTHLWGDDWGASGVVLVDWLLIAIILGFRLFKTFGDPHIKYVGQPSGMPERTIDPSRSPPVDLDDWARVVPKSVASNLGLLRRVGAEGADGLVLESPAELGIASLLAADDAISLGLHAADPPVAVARLTYAGRVFVAFADEAGDASTTATR